MCIDVDINPKHPTNNIDVRTIYIPTSNTNPIMESPLLPHDIFPTYEWQIMVSHIHNPRYVHLSFFEGPCKVS